MKRTTNKKLQKEVLFNKKGKNNMKNNREYEAVVNKVWNMYYNDEKTIQQIIKIVVGVNEVEVRKMLGLQPIKKAQVG